MELKPVSYISAEHYKWGDGCEGWRLVSTDGLSVIEERMPKGTAETRHSHAEARQFFYVLAGRLTLEVEGETHHLGPYQGLEIPPGAAHQVFNHAPEDVRFLVTSQPPSQDDRNEL